MIIKKLVIDKNKFLCNNSFVLMIGFAQIAQSVEQKTENLCVGGSIPPLGTIYLNILLIWKVILLLAF